MNYLIYYCMRKIVMFHWSRVRTMTRQVKKQLLMPKSSKKIKGKRRNGRFTNFNIGCSCFCHVNFLYICCSCSAELCESQKYQLALKNKGKEPLSWGPRPGIYQNYDLMMFEFDKLVALNVLPSQKSFVINNC